MPGVFEPIVAVLRWAGVLCAALASFVYARTLTGPPGITHLGVTFAPAIANAKQFRVEGLAAIPEPATWALMVLGVGGMGLMLRRQRARMASA